MEDFWTLLPVELDAFQRRHAQAQERDEWPFGILACTIANFSMYAPKKILKPADFGLGPRSQGVAAHAPISQEEQVAALRTWAKSAANLGG